MVQQLQEQLIADLTLRVSQLQREADTWKTLTQGNSQGMGIHKSQVDAVSLMIEEFLVKQAELLTKLEPQMEALAFAKQRQEVEQELTGTHSIMAVFRNILTQRADPEYYGNVLDCADLVAASCYLSCIVRARNWDVLTDEQFREPPLTYLNAKPHPLAWTRRYQFGVFGSQIDDTKINEHLPISVISLPIHYTEAVWTYCSIYHEVGHPLDQDLGLHGALLGPLQRRLNASPRLRYWEKWLSELIADAFGVLFGGTAYVHSMLNLLLLPKSQVTRIDPTDKHPNHYVRIFLLGALLRETGNCRFVVTAGEIEGAWRQIYGDPSKHGTLNPYIPECQAVADVLLHERLAVLNNNYCLQDFTLGWDNDQIQIDALASYLSTDQLRPKAEDYPIRLVPAAAQIAAKSVTQNHLEAYKAIHQRALKFMLGIRRPEELGPGEFTPARENYLRSLVRAFNFGEIYASE